MKNNDSILKYMPISKLTLTNRLKIILKHHNILTLYDLYILKESEILQIKNFGKRILLFFNDCKNNTMFFKKQLEACNLSTSYTFLDKLDEELLLKEEDIKIYNTKASVKDKKNNKLYTSTSINNKICKYKFNENLKNIYIEFITLDKITKNLLYRSNIFNLYDLFNLTNEDINQIKGLGIVNYQKILSYIEKFFKDKQFYYQELAFNNLPKDYNTTENVIIEPETIEQEPAQLGECKDYKNYIFPIKPSINEIIKFIASININFLDNDREFFTIFDSIALNNKYTKTTLPSYWSIEREIYRYKQEYKLANIIQENNIINFNYLLDLSLFDINLDNCKFKPTIINIINFIGQTYPAAFNDDRLLVKLFDTVAVNLGLEYKNLPKYLTIIRAAYNCKHNVNISNMNKNSSNKPIDVISDAEEAIDYRIFQVSLNTLELDAKILHKLTEMNLNTIGDLVSYINTAKYPYLKRKQGEIYKALSKYGIQEGISYTPAIITLPDLFYKNIDKIFDFKLVQFLKHYKFKNVGMLVNKFPDIILKDDEAMLNSNTLGYIQEISAILKNYNIQDFPQKLSIFQIADLNELTLEELQEKNYVKELIDIISEKISQLSNKLESILIKRYGLDGRKEKTLEEIGTEYQLTRERIRQLIKRGISCIKKDISYKLYDINRNLNILFNHNVKCIAFEIEPYFKLYQKILLDILSNKDVSFYINFEIGLVIENDTTLENLLENESIEDTTKNKIEKYLYKDYLKINNRRIKDNKLDVLIYFLQTYCKKSIKYTDFQNLYIDFLVKNGLDNREDLLYLDNTLYNKLSVLNCILLSPGKVIKYINPEDAKYIASKIDLSDYKNIEISARKIYNDNINLMLDFNITDEYELHNLLKKYKNDNNIDFSRMPTIKFGIANKNEQIVNLLKELSPIKVAEFADAYEEKYGINHNTFMANYTACISNYFYNGWYIIDTPKIPMNILNILKKYLNKDFYWKDEFINLYKTIIPNIDYDYTNINLGALREIGYTASTNYIFSNKYSSLSEYIKAFLSEPIVNLRVNTKYKTIPSFYTYLNDMKNNLELIEFAPDMYINISKLRQVGIDKLNLLNYSKRVVSFIGDKYFTISSLKNEGFTDTTLEKLGFEDYFYSSILSVSPCIQYKKILNVYLMKVDTDSFDINDFLTYIMGSLRKVDIYDLCKLLQSKYNIILNKSKIIAITKECELYYNQITEKIYIDYDEFYNGI